MSDRFHTFTCGDTAGNNGKWDSELGACGKWESELRACENGTVNSEVRSWTGPWSPTGSTRSPAGTQQGITGNGAVNSERLENGRVNSERVKMGQ